MAANVEIPPSTDVRRVQNLGQVKFLQKPNAQAKSAQKPNDWASFHDF